jgi:hypothetical protein
MWWKWCSYLWPMILWWNIIITLVFWLFIDFGEASIWPKSKQILDHTLPVFVSVFDWLLNAIVIERQHIWSQLPIVFLYALLNFSIVRTTGYVIYPGVTWDNSPCFIAAFVLFTIIVGLWYLLA